MLIVNMLKYTLMSKIPSNNCRLFELKAASLVQLAARLIKHADLVLQHECQVTYAQFKVLVFLELCQSITQRELADHLQLTQAAISRLIETLEHKHLINRIENPANRRANQISLTEQGKTLIQAAFKIIFELENNLFAPLSKSEIENWQKATGKLLEQVNQSSLKPA